MLSDAHNAVISFNCEQLCYKGAKVQQSKVQQEHSRQVVMVQWSCGFAVIKHSSNLQMGQDWLLLPNTTKTGFVFGAGMHGNMRQCQRMLTRHSNEVANRYVCACLLLCLNRFGNVILALPPHLMMSCSSGERNGPATNCSKYRSYKTCTKTGKLWVITQERKTRKILGQMLMVLLHA